MKKWIFRLIVWYLRKHAGELAGTATAYRAVPKHRRRYHIVLLWEAHYSALKAKTTWTRSENL